MSASLPALSSAADERGAVFHYHGRELHELLRHRGGFRQFPALALERGDDEIGNLLAHGANLFDARLRGITMKRHVVLLFSFDSVNRACRSNGGGARPLKIRFEASFTTMMG